MAPRLTPEVRALRAITEAQWHFTVYSHASRAGWMVHFVPDNLYRVGFKERGPMDMGHRGFPDLTMTRAGILLFRELKTETGKLGEEQEHWRDRLLAAGCDWAIWRPSDLDSIVRPTLWGNRDAG